MKSFSLALAIILFFHPVVIQPMDPPVVQAKKKKYSKKVSPKKKKQKKAVVVARPVEPVVKAVQTRLAIGKKQAKKVLKKKKVVKPSKPGKKKASSNTSAQEQKQLVEKWVADFKEELLATRKKNRPNGGEEDIEGKKIIEKVTEEEREKATVYAQYQPRDLEFLRKNEVPANIKAKLDKIFTPDAVKTFSQAVTQYNSANGSFVAFAKAIVNLEFVQMEDIQERLRRGVMPSFVYRHPELPYIFKFGRHMQDPGFYSWKFNSDRIVYAEMLRKLIAQAGMQNIIKIPKKYVYFIPGMPVGWDAARIVVAEKMNLRPAQSCRKEWYPNHPNIKERLTKILDEAQYADRNAGNIICRGEPFNDIIIIDTEAPTPFSTMTTPEFRKKAMAFMEQL